MTAATTMTETQSPPLVSIVIPCYNGAKYIASTLRSALQQTYPAIEVVVIDDGSTDDSPAIIRSFSPPVRYIRTKNSGQCAARNLGIQLAGGTYIQFLDSDNIITPDKIERSVEVLQREPEVDAVFSQIVIPKDFSFDHTYTPPASIVNMSEEDVLKEVYFPWGNTGIPSLEPAMPLYRRSAFEKGGCWDETLSVWEDVEFSGRLFLAGVVFKYVHMIGVIYRDHSGERLTHQSEFHSPEMLKTVRAMMAFRNTDSPYKERLADFATKFLVWVGARECVARREFRRARQYLALAREIAPGNLPGPPIFQRLSAVLGPLVALTVLNTVMNIKNRRSPWGLAARRIGQVFR